MASFCTSKTSISLNQTARLGFFPPWSQWFTGLTSILAYLIVTIFLFFILKTCQYCSILMYFWVINYRQNSVYLTHSSIPLSINIIWGTREICVGTNFKRTDLRICLMDPFGTLVRHPLHLLRNSLYFHYPVFVNSRIWSHMRGWTIPLGLHMVLLNKISLLISLCQSDKSPGTLRSFIDNYAVWRACWKIRFSSRASCIALELL